MAKHISDTLAMKSVNFAHFIVDGARINEEVVGTRLLESLRAPIAMQVRESDFNPKHCEMGFEEVCQWLEDHIVFDHNGAQIGLHDGSTWLWKEDVDG